MAPLCAGGCPDAAAGESSARSPALRRQFPKRGALPPIVPAVSASSEAGGPPRASGPAALRLEQGTGTHYAPTSARSRSRSTQRLVVPAPKALPRSAGLRVAQRRARAAGCCGPARRSLHGRSAGRPTASLGAARSREGGEGATGGPSGGTPPRRLERQAHETVGRSRTDSPHLRSAPGAKAEAAGEASTRAASPSARSVRDKRVEGERCTSSSGARRTWPANAGASAARRSRCAAARRRSKLSARIRPNSAVSMRPAAPLRREPARAAVERRVLRDRRRRAQLPAGKRRGCRTRRSRGPRRTRREISAACADRTDVTARSRHCIPKRIGRTAPCPSEAFEHARMREQEPDGGEGCLGRRRPVNKQGRGEVHEADGSGHAAQAPRAPPGRRDVRVRGGHRGRSRAPRSRRLGLRSRGFRSGD